MLARKVFLLLIIGVFAAAAAACGSGKSIPQADSVDTLAQALSAAGLTVNGPLPNDVLSSRFFSIPGVSFQVGNEKVQAYEFSSDDDAAQERAIVSSDGYGIGPKYINWSVAPNFYGKGRLIVIYDGDKTAVKHALASAMGERFAGSDVS